MPRNELTNSRPDPSGGGFKTIGIAGKPHKDDVKRTASKLTHWLRKHGIDVVLEDHLGDSAPVPLPSREELPRHADMIIVLGGDGTLLSVARAVGNDRVPILGINMGGLGFLTDITLSEMFPLLKEILEGNYTVRKRMLLKTTITRKSGTQKTFQALNDVVINKGALARIIDIKAAISGEYLTTYRSDGLIVSTPVGSTGYSLSAGGPIVCPGVNGIIITPICPHTLTNRPILIKEDDTVTLTLLSKEDEVIVTVDGQVGHPIGYEDTVEISKSDNSIAMIVPPGKSYYEILRTKLKWGER